MENLFLKILLDVFCLILFGIPLLVYNYSDVVPVSSIGFFCDDNSLRYPYHQSTVPSSFNILLAFGAMLFLSIFVESSIYYKFKRKSRKPFIHSIFAEVYRSFGYFIIGAAANQLLTDVCKKSVGRLRPHFFDICQPDFLCTSATQHVYVEYFNCTRKSHPFIEPDKFPRQLQQMRKSFPSGHSSLAMFAYLYMVIYLEYRMRMFNLRLLRHVFQLALLAWAFWICCSRIFDFKHHPSDVIAGMVLGTIAAIVTAHLYVCSFNPPFNQSPADACAGSMNGGPCVPTAAVSRGTSPFEGALEPHDEQL